MNDITRLMIGTENKRSYPITVRGKLYEVITSDFLHFDGTKTRVWNAYLNGTRIRCFTRTEERRFPKTVARMAEAILRAETASI